jgi:hypothetical protein
MAVRLSASRADSALFVSNIVWYSFLFEAESTQSHTTAGGTR